MATNHDYVALVEVGQQEEAAPGTIGAAAPTTFLPETRNVANDENVVMQIQSGLLPIIDWTRKDRIPLEEEWKAVRRMEMLEHDDGRRYIGRSNSYLPVYNRILTTLVSSLSRGLFPSDDYMDVADRQNSGAERAKATKTYLQWEFDANAKLRTNIKPWLRQFENFGISVLKHRYKKEIRSQGKTRFDRESDSRKLLAAAAFSPTNVYEGLSTQTRNVFNWYIYPNTVDCIEEAQVIFEDIRVPRSFIMEMKLKERWENVEDALNQGNPPEHDSKEQELAATMGGSSSAPGGLAGNQYAESKVITEVWCFLVLPRDQYVGDENPELPLPCRVVLAGNVVLLVTRNPMFEQRPPYEVSVQNRSPGFFYGYGHGRVVRSLQYLANDFANQVNDNGSYCLNPIAKVNPGHLAGPLKPLKPGVTWYLTDVHNGAIFDRPPVEQIQYGLQLLNTVIGMAQDFGGAPPVLQGSSAGRGAKTATGAQILQRNAMQPLQDVVEDIELEALIPLMKSTWFLAHQYRSDDVMAMVGGQLTKVPLEMLMGDFDFRWLASSQAANQQMRAQQLMQFMQIMAPILPVLMQQGYIVDFEPIARRIWSDGFGMRGFDQIIRKAQAAPGAQPGQVLPQGQQGGVAAEQGDRVRSALEQVAGGGGGEMVPGEGEDFMSVRGQADELAGMMGGMP